jgi:nitrate reductase NapAB chaperone NapD
MSILGCVLRVKAENLPRVLSALGATAGVDVAMNPGDGRLVLILEDSAETTAAQTFAAMALFPEVLSASLVYEYSGPDAPSALTEAESTRYQSWRTTMADMAKDHPLTQSSI